MLNENLIIVFADDDEDDRFLFQEAFEELKLEYELKIFSSGIEMIGYLNSSDKKPNMVFLDLNMPIKTGLECLKEIKREDHLKDIPVIIYSTSSAETDIQDTFDFGASVYIKKPTDFSELKNVIHNLLKMDWKNHRIQLNKHNFLFTI